MITLSLNELDELHTQAVLRKHEVISISVPANDWKILKYKVYQLQLKQKGLFGGSNFDSLKELLNLVLFNMCTPKTENVKKAASLLSNYSTSYRISINPAWRNSDGKIHLLLEPRVKT